MVRPDWSAALHAELRRRGVLVMPSGYGRLFLSFAHDEAVLAGVADAFRDAAMALR
jgi:glutamate-1-semialdehyde 2,1-aminomutase